MRVLEQRWAHARMVRLATRTHGQAGDDVTRPTEVAIHSIFPPSFLSDEFVHLNTLSSSGHMFSNAPWHVAPASASE